VVLFSTKEVLFHQFSQLNPLFLEENNVPHLDFHKPHLKIWSWQPDVTTTLPFVGYQIYRLNVPPNPNNTLRLAIDQLLAAVSYSFYFINYSVFNF